MAALATSLLNQVLISSYFGISSALDAYWIAFAVMNLLAFPLTPLREALVPEFHRQIKKSSQDASEYFSKVLTLILMIAAGGAVIGVLFSHTILGWFDTKGDSHIRAQEVYFLLWLSPTILLLALSDTLGSLLSAYNRVLIQGLFRLFAVAASTAMIAIAAGFMDTFVLVVSFIAGQIVSIGCFIVALWKEGLRYKFCWPTQLGKNFIYTSGALISSYAISQIYSVYEKLTFASFSSGLVSAFQYAVSITNVIITVIGLSIANVLLPRFMNHAVDSEHGLMLRDLILSLKFILLALGGLCLLIYLLAPAIVEIIFLRGAFDQVAATKTTQALQWAIFAAVPISMGAVIGKFLLSRNFAKSIAIIGALTGVSGIVILYIARQSDFINLAMSHWVIANVFGVAISFILLSKSMPQPIQYYVVGAFWVIKLSIVLALAYFAATYLPEITLGFASESNFTWMQLVIRTGIFCCTYIFLLYSFKLFSDFRQ